VINIPPSPGDSDDDRNDLSVHLDSLALLQPHGWPAPTLVLKPPFHPVACPMPPGWEWGTSCLGDPLDASVSEDGDANAASPPTGEAGPTHLKSSSRHHCQQHDTI